MDDIDFKKEDIAKAISLAFADGDKFKAEKEFPYIYETIKNCKHFIFKNTSSLSGNSYSKSIDSLLDEIDKRIGYFSVKKSFYNPDKFSFKGDFLQANTSGVDENLVDKLKKAYFSNKKIFLRLGISYQAFIILAVKNGEENAIELAGLVKKLAVKSKMYKLKSFFSNYQDLANFKISAASAFEVIDDFKVDSLDDIFKIYTLVSSFFVSKSDLNDKEEQIIEENKLKLKKIIKNPELINSESYILKLKEKLERVFQARMFTDMLEFSNCKDFFKRYGFEVSGDNLLILSREYYYSYNVSGFRSVNKFDKKGTNVVYFNSNLFNSCVSYQNETIIHEFIHCLEPVLDNGIEKPFNVKCRYLNEALTEFLSLEALKYLNGNIIESNDFVDCSESVSVYCCLLPMVEILKNSTLWFDVLSCKKMNDYSLLEDRIGKDAKRIAELFNLTYVKRNVEFFDKNLPEEDELEELTKIIKKIEKNNPRYNKRISI